MRQLLLAWRTLSLAALVVLSGCGKSPPSGESASEENETPATFKEGWGLQLAATTSAALGVTTAGVEERPIARTYEVTASVFDAGPPARASSLVSAEIGAELETHSFTGAQLLSVRRELSAALNQVEIVLVVPGAPAVGTTVNLSLRGPARQSVAVPRAALLTTATGAFVYVVNGAHLLRTPVRPGASDGEYIEILDGLYAGDVVATAAIEHLWLTELRLTKGGGHSH